MINYILLQIPQGIPNQSQPIDLSSATEVTLYIVIPLIMIIVYIFIKKKRNNRQSWAVSFSWFVPFLVCALIEQENLSNSLVYLKMWITRLISCWLLFGQLFCQDIPSKYFDITKSNIDTVIRQHRKNKSFFSTEKEKQKSRWGRIVFTGRRPQGKPDGSIKSRVAFTGKLRQVLQWQD